MIELGLELSQGLEPLDRQLEIDENLLLDHTLILGPNGSEKTTLGLQLIESVVGLGLPVLALDTTGDISGSAMEMYGAQMIRGFDDNIAPADPRFQLNVIDVPAAFAMFHRPLEGSSQDELWTEEAHALVAALLDLLGYRVRGLTPEVVLLENVVLTAWSAGSDLSLRELATFAAAPPFRSLGMFPVDSVIDPGRRSDLASAILSLLEAPGFSDEHPAVPLNLAALLTQPDGSAAAAIISFAQRSEAVRRFLAAVVFAKLSTFVKYRFNDDWLSLLVYLDEGSSFLPAAARVSTTKVMLHMLDSWRRFGVGVALVAEHPLQIHEDALDLCETWVVGQMPVARARRDVVEELDLVNPPIDEVALDEVLGQMKAGHFVIRSPRLDNLHYFNVAGV